jgi:hypothetical protein
MEEKAEKERKKIVVEEISAKESPKGEEEKKTNPQILDEAAKVSSEELVSNKNIQLNETPSTPPESPKKSPPIFWIIVPGIFLLGAILGGIIFYQKGANKGREETIATPTPAATPTASPSASIDLTKYTIAVYNGSGIAGEAGKVKTLLTDAGFEVSTTANAANYDYTKTIIKAKADVEKTYTDKLSETLLKTYEVDTLQTLATSSATDVQVVVGSTKVEAL